MTKKKNALFFILEVASGLTFGMLSVFIISPSITTNNLITSIFIGFLLYYSFAFLGIGLVGFLHYRAHKKSRKFPMALLNALIGMVIGVIIVIVLSPIVQHFLPYRLASFYIPIVLPILSGVLGFNLQIRR